ncbi:DUF2931 family protein [Prevotella melaninogenica]|uniref:DUF2931 family protein n=1 Tax=Prevotella melaninogenica TaxID=28132 RepID=UPI001C609150|nr:DUF2931 family protein [Prevotella melaninogenica]
MFKGNNTKFHWTPTVAAPRNYPVETGYAVFIYGDKDVGYPVMETRFARGIGDPLSAEDFDAPGSVYELPKRIRVLWLSITEQKYYKADIEIPAEVQDSMLHLFQKGFYYPVDKTSEDYNTIVLTLLPGGKMWLTVAGARKQTLICDNLKATETHVDFKDFNKEAYECFSTTQKYCAAALGDYDGVKENLEEVGIPFDLWDVYKERFDYTIKIDFENNKTKLDSAYTSYEFTNTDFLYDGDKSPLTMKAHPFHIGFIWLVDHYKYTGEFYFDEEEVIKVFREAFNQGKRKEKGVLHIHISKYNNRFDLSLNVGEDEYKLKHTNIYVLKRRIGSTSTKEEVFYDNCRDVDIDELIFLGF